MTDFSAFFYKTKGQPLEYNSRTIFMADKIPVNKGDIFLVRFEKTNSVWKQAIAFRIEGKIFLDNEMLTLKKGIIFWERLDRKEVKFVVYPKKEYMLVYNAWDKGRGTTERWTYGAAMYSEDIENGKRYFCNDGHPDENFDDIVFTLQKIGSVVK